MTLPSSETPLAWPWNVPVGSAMNENEVEVPEAVRLIEWGMSEDVVGMALPTITEPLPEMPDDLKAMFEEAH